MRSDSGANDTWRVTTWNLLGSADPDAGAIAARLADLDADVVALQEVRRGQAHRIAKNLRWGVVWRRKHYPYSPLVWWRAEGLAVLSRHHMSDVRRDTLSRREPIWIYRHRVMVSVRVHRGTSALRVHDLHLASDDADARVAQAVRAVDAARAYAHRTGTSGAPVVVCGDLNAADEPAVLGALGALGVRDPGGAHSEPADAPRQRLDYVLVPEHARAATSSTPPGGPDWRQLSDHLPVTATFTVGGSPPTSDGAGQIRSQ